MEYGIAIQCLANDIKFFASMDDSLWSNEAVKNSVNAIHEEIENVARSFGKTADEVKADINAIA